MFVCVCDFASCISSGYLKKGRHVCLCIYVCVKRDSKAYVWAFAYSICVSVSVLGMCVNVILLHGCQMCVCV